jgi:hypothetical protein
VNYVSPSSGTGTSTTFYGNFSDPNGGTAIDGAEIYISSTLGGSATCDIGYSFGQLWLTNDAGTALLGPVALGSSATVSNSQCTIGGGSGGTASTSGNSLTISVPVTFSNSFAGTQSIWAYAEDWGSGLNSGFEPEGSWTVDTPAAIMTTSLPMATVGTAYSVSLSGSGGTTPYTWSLASGALPSGLTLSANGVLSGAAMAVALGGGSITVRLTDTLGQVITASYSLGVQVGQLMTRAVTPSDFTFSDGVGRTYSYYVCDVNWLVYGCYYTDSVSGCTIDSSVAVSVVASHTTFAATFTASRNAMAGGKCWGPRILQRHAVAEFWL